MIYLSSYLYCTCLIILNKPTSFLSISSTSLFLRNTPQKYVNVEKLLFILILFHIACFLGCVGKCFHYWKLMKKKCLMLLSNNISNPFFFYSFRRRALILQDALAQIHPWTREKLPWKYQLNRKIISYGREIQNLN